MTRNVTFAGETAKYRTDQVEAWLIDIERVCRELSEQLARQAESCALHRQTIADIRAQMDDIAEVEALSGGPVTIAKDEAA